MYLLLTPFLTQLLLSLLPTAAQSDLSLQASSYGTKYKCASDLNIEFRENMADVVLSGRVKSVHRHIDDDSSYHCSIKIYRVMKGDDIVASLLDDSAEKVSFYTRTVEVSGFGNDKICDSNVVHGDTRIFLLSYSRDANLTLNSSLIRIGIRTLKLPVEVPMREYTSECKFFFCSFYAQCKLGPLTKDPYCECPGCENEIPEQVCASDGNWYRNVCETRKASCIQRRRIKPQHPSRCQGTPAPTTRNSLTTFPPRDTPEPTNPASLNTTTPIDKSDPCAKEKCEFGAICKVSIDGLGSRCECPSNCEENFGDSPTNQPVCGSDGKDYSNECSLRATACASLKDITVARPGKCDPCSDVDCPPGKACVVGEFNTAICECTSMCAAVSQPVCGTDGRTYENDCLLRYASCLQPNSTITIAYSGRCKFAKNPCEDITCEHYATCRVSENGAATCRCPDNCPIQANIVCGSNGKDYTNLCKLQQEACIREINITVAANQPCADDACVNYECPHSGQCNLMPTKPSGDLVPICICPTCSAVIRPVCGEDGITYTNECSLRQTNCEKERDVRISHSGACSLCEDMTCELGVCHNRNGTAVCLCAEDVCVESNSPVCADDGVTYSNMCELSVESCRQQKKILKVFDGTCDGNRCQRDDPCLYKGLCIGTRCLCDFPCTDDVDYVCGSDTKTYPNQCALEKASCDSQTLITVVSSGRCEDKQSGTGDEGNHGGDDGGDGDGVTGQAGQMGKPETTTPTDTCSANCKFDGLCDYADGSPGVCRCDGFFDYCEDKGQQVCGSNGVLYENICELREFQCQTQKEISNRPTEFCLPESTTSPPMSNTTQSITCYDSQSPLTDLTDNKYINCTGCLPNRPAQCDLCPDSSYCNSQNGVCCPRDPAIPECTYTQFGCCLYEKTLPSPGPDHRGCPYTCQCGFGANGALCDPITFQCDCMIGVVGKTCDQCKPGWWGIKLIKTKDNEGCLPCQCNDMGSTRSDCEQTTGRCLCKSGVTGNKCDTCAEEGMTLTSEGCKSSNESFTDTSQQETCDTKDCGNGQCVTDDNLKAICTCNYNCSDETDYICGSDGQTYTNICYLRREACVDPDLMEIKRGVCQPDEPTLELSRDDSTRSTSLLSTTEVVPLITTPEKGIWDSWFGSNRYLADEGKEDKTFSMTDEDLYGVEACEEATCQNGGTCVNDTKQGHVCLCNVHWKGPNCQQANDFTSPSFSGSSFIQYLWSDTASSLFDLRLSIIPTEESGVILFSGEATGRNDFMSLVLNNGYIQFRFNNGGGTVLLQSESKLSTNNRYDIRIMKDGKAGLLTIRGQSTISKEAPGSLANLDIEPIINIGLAYLDYPLQPPKRLLRNLGGVTQGFSGCITMLHDTEANINFILQNTREANIMNGRSIDQCTSNPCLKSPCLNNGLCQMINAFNYKCECPNPFSGPNCNTRSKRTRHLIGSLANRYRGAGNVFELPRLSGRSYLQYPLTSEVDYKFNFDIVFNTAHADGVLLYGSQNKDQSDGDFILLSLKDQIPVLRFDLGSGVTELRLDEKFPLKQWNLLTFNRSGKHVWMSLNGLPSKATTAKGEMSYLNVEDHITLGAIPDIVSHDRGYLHSSGFQGVIQRVAINGDDIADFFGSASFIYGIKRYHGLPCHPNPCNEGYYCIPELESYRCDLRY